MIADHWETIAVGLAQKYPADVVSAIRHAYYHGAVALLSLQMAAYRDNDRLRFDLLMLEVQSFLVETGEFG